MKSFAAVEPFAAISNNDSTAPGITVRPIARTRIHCRDASWYRNKYDAFDLDAGHSCKKGVCSLDGAGCLVQGRIFLREDCRHHPKALLVCRRMG